MFYAIVAIFQPYNGGSSFCLCINEYWIYLSVRGNIILKVFLLIDTQLVKWWKYLLILLSIYNTISNREQHLGTLAGKTLIDWMMIRTQTLQRINKINCPRTHYNPAHSSFCGGISQFGLIYKIRCFITYIHLYKQYITGAYMLKIKSIQAKLIGINHLLEFFSKDLHSSLAAPVTPLSWGNLMK